MAGRAGAVCLALCLVLVGCGSSGTGTATLPTSGVTTSRGSTTSLATATTLNATTTLASAARGKWAPATVVGTSNTTFVVVGCASATFCIAVDQGQNAFTFNGSTWSAGVPVDPLGNPNAVACVSASSCILTDLQGNFSVFNGSTWTAPARFSKTGLVDGASCPAPTFCVAVDAAGNALTYNGSTWSAPQVIDPVAKQATDDVNAGKAGDLINLRVSCPTTSFCAVIDTVGNAMTFNGSSWTTPAVVNAGTKPLGSSLSCASPTFCMATKSNTYVVFDGSSWGSAKPFGQNTSFDKVACPAAGFCMATSQGTWATFDGTVWSLPPTNATRLNSALAMTCASKDFCVAVGAYGNVSLYSGT